MKNTKKMLKSLGAFISLEKSIPTGKEENFSFILPISSYIANSQIFLCHFLID